MAISRRPLDVDNYSALDGGTGLAIPGYYSRVHLNDIINNFIIAYIGDGKILSKVPRYEVAFWAQRSVQEFSYDIFHSEKTIEVELSETLQMSLPSDYVNYVNISFLDNFGNLKTIQPSRSTKATKAVTQDEDYKYLYDNDGKVVFKETSDTLDRYQTTNRVLTAEEASDYYNGYYDNDDYSYFGRRYGSEPERQNFNGSYVLDLEAGKIFFDSSFKQGSIIVLRYISDGIGDNDNFDNVLVPKLAEDAVYANILYNLSKLRVSSASASGLYKKEASAKMRNAKIRLSNMKTEEMAQVLRGKSKWIKH
mgnify:FL=1|tara:strand:+ start:1931 stop:2854 length:924 start_codon:yes stop_codon:yes gene_type:complete